MGKPITRTGTNKLYFAYRDLTRPPGKQWVNRIAGDYVIGQEAMAQQYIDEFLRGLEAGEQVDGPVTVRRFVDKWLSNRHTASVNDDRARLTKHVLPRIGDMHMIAVKPTTIDDLITALRNEKILAPTTIRQIGGLLSQVFKRATKEGVITSSPVLWERGTLPRAVDKDPTWRHQAIFTRAEAEILISHPSILWDRRILTAMKFLAALRHTEAATMTWSQYDSNVKPLGSFNLGETKSGVPRRMPVHPVLAKLLAEWRLSGWFQTYGRTPTSDDLIVPTRNMTDDNPRGTARKPSESQEAFLADLATLKLRVKAGATRNRRGHDLRRTFVTFAIADGAVPLYLKKCTHGPTKKDMMDLYSTPPWEVLCAEVAKLKIEPRTGQLISMPLLQGSCKPEVSSAISAIFVGKRWKKARPQRDSNPCYRRERPVS